MAASGRRSAHRRVAFKLKESKPEAEKLAKQHPDDYQVGSWVTARFSADKPLPKKLWQKWMDESYELARPAKRAAEKTKRK